MIDKDGPASPFELDRELNPDRLNEEFRKSGRLRVRNFFRPASADAIYQHLAHNIAWRTFLVSNERLMATPYGEPTTADDDEEIFEHAHHGAQRGFASVYDADRAFPEDMSTDVSTTAASSSVVPEDRLVSILHHSLNSEPFKHVVSRIIGLGSIDHINIHATRFRPGHFVMFHSATRSADKTAKRRASFYLNLTPEWKPEWGGLLEFRTSEGDIVEAFVPAFNVLDIFEFPRGYWISHMSPLACNPILAIAGRIYA